MGIKLKAKGKSLPDGGCIGLLTGAPLSVERFQAGLKTLESLGLRAKYPIDPTVAYGDKQQGFVAAPAAERARAMYELLQDREVSVVLAVRGAYGALDLLPRLDSEQLRAAGKLVIGSSDITVLLLQSLRAEIPAIHGSTLGDAFADYGEKDYARESVDALVAMLRQPEFRIEQKVESLRAGSARGPLLAGNLSMLLTVLGTPWDIDYSGAILVIEDVGEAPYRIHRALTQLKLAGKLERLSGVVFGRFSKCEAKSGPSVDEVMEMAVRDIFPNSPFPVVRGLEAGHWGKNIPLPMGCLAEISGNTFRTLESPISGLQ